MLYKKYQTRHWRNSKALAFHAVDSGLIHRTALGPQRTPRMSDSTATVENSLTMVYTTLCVYEKERKRDKQIDRQTPGSAGD